MNTFNPWKIGEQNESTSDIITSSGKKVGVIFNGWGLKLPDRIDCEGDEAARLVAAAPELLEAVDNAVQCLEQVRIACHIDFEETIAICRKAILKATTE